MRNVMICVVLLSCAAPVMAQDAQPDGRLSTPATPAVNGLPTDGLQSPSVGRPQPVEVEVPPSAPVVVLNGVCDPAPVPAKKTACKTVLTRGELDYLADLLMPGTPPAAHRQFAVNYARLLAATATAERQNLEKDPAVANELQAKLKFVRMQVLSSALYHNFEEQAQKVSSVEVEKYYTDHPTIFQEGEVLRIAIPKTPRPVNGIVADPATLKAKAEDIRARAAAGEDFAQLQESAYKDLGINTPSVPTKPTNVRRSSLPPSEARVFDLQPGEVSQVEESPEAFIVLKLVSKQSIPLTSVQAEIKSLLQQQHLKQELQTASEGVKGQFNLVYLGVPTAPELFPSSGLARTSSSMLGKAPDARQRTMARRRRVSPPGAVPAPASPPAQ
jgi:hypothetical protein